MTLWQSYRCPGLWWFRLFGYGVRGKRIAAHPLLFSERVGGAGLRLAGWHFLFLRKAGA